MKKLFLISLVLLLGIVASAQNTITLYPDTAGTIVGSGAGVLHKFTSGNIQSGALPYSIEVFVTASGTHVDDSTRVHVYGSMDNVNFFKITDLGTPWTTASGAYRAGTDITAYRLSNGGGATGGWVWHPTWYLQYRYIQVRITQYKVGSILTVNKCRLHLFR